MPTPNHPFAPVASANSSIAPAPLRPPAQRTMDRPRPAPTHHRESPAAETPPSQPPSEAVAAVRKLADLFATRAEEDRLHERVLSCFCTHSVPCAVCQSKTIIGARYRCEAPCSDVNLCESCRRMVRDAGYTGAFTVYDYPWEASADYTIGADRARERDERFRVPAAPLRLGDSGPGVTHLQYVLYQIGHLNVCLAAFRAGIFCGITRDGVSKFQLEQNVVEEGALGVYTVLTRQCVLGMFDELEMRWQSVPCSRIAGTDNPRLRTALAA